MAFDDCELSKGVSYEVLQENEFTRQISSYTNGFVRLHPYNQVAGQQMLENSLNLTAYYNQIQGIPKMFSEIRKEAQGLSLP